MKKEYIMPSIDDLRIDTDNVLLEASVVGEIGAGSAWAKKQEAEFEEEEQKTGVPTAFANIWGDEEEKED